MQKQSNSNQKSVNLGHNIYKEIEAIKGIDFEKFRIFINVVGATKAGKSLRSNQMIGFPLIKLSRGRKSGLFAIDSESTTIINTHYIHSNQIKENYFVMSELQQLEGFKQYNKLVEEIQKQESLPANKESLQKVLNFHLDTRSKLIQKKEQNQKENNLQNLSYQEVTKEYKIKTKILKSQYQILNNQFLTNHCILVDYPGFQDNAMKNMINEMKNQSYSKKSIIIFCINPYAGNIDAKSSKQLQNYYTSSDPDNIFLSISAAGIHCNYKGELQNISSFYYAAFIQIPTQLKNTLQTALQILKQGQINNEKRQKIQTKIKRLEQFIQNHEKIYQINTFSYANRASLKQRLKKEYQNAKYQYKLQQIINCFPFELITFHGFNFLSFLQKKEIAQQNSFLIKLINYSYIKQTQQLQFRTKVICTETRNNILFKCIQQSESFLNKMNLQKLSDSQFPRYKQLKMNLEKIIQLLIKKLNQNFVQCLQEIENKYQKLKTFLINTKNKQFETKNIYWFRSTVKQDIQAQINQHFNQFISQAEKLIHQLLSKCQDDIKYKFKDLKPVKKVQKQAIETVTIKTVKYLQFCIGQLLTNFKNMVVINQSLGKRYGLVLDLKQLSNSIWERVLQISRILIAPVLFVSGRMLIYAAEITAGMVVAAFAFPVSVLATIGLFSYQQISKAGKDQLFIKNIRQFRNYLDLVRKSFQELAQRNYNQASIKVSFDEPQYNAYQIIEQLKKQENRVQQSFKKHIGQPILKKQKGNQVKINDKGFLKYYIKDRMKKIFNKMNYYM